MAGKAVSYRFVDALAKSTCMGADTVKQALAEIGRLQAEIARLQDRTQALEHPAQDKAPTNHAI